MLEMPTIDQTQEWEEHLDSEGGDLKFPVTLLENLDSKSFEIEVANIDIGNPRLKKSTIKEIKLGKKPKNKGNELF